MANHRVVEMTSLAAQKEVTQHTRLRLGRTSITTCLGLAKKNPESWPRMVERNQVKSWGGGISSSPLECLGLHFSKQLEIATGNHHETP